MLDVAGVRLRDGATLAPTGVFARTDELALVQAAARPARPGIATDQRAAARRNVRRSTVAMLRRASPVRCDLAP
jgi:hypothetical protein